MRVRQKDRERARERRVNTVTEKEMEGRTKSERTTKRDK